MKTLYLIRHGQSEGNVNPQLYFEVPDCDIKLTDLGIKQAKDVGEKLTTISNINDKFYVFSSPFVRTIETTHYLKSTLNRYSTVPRLDNRLIERNWEGLRELVGTRPTFTGEYFKFDFKVENTANESLLDCRDRMEDFWNYFKRINDPDIQNGIIVSHGEALKLLLMVILKWTEEEYYSFKNIKNCEVIILELQDDSNYKLKTRV